MSPYECETQPGKYSLMQDRQQGLRFGLFKTGETRWVPCRKPFPRSDRIGSGRGHGGAACRCPGVRLCPRLNRRRHRARIVGPITDPVGNFLPSYTGSRDPRLDVTPGSVTFDASQFALTVTLAGPVIPLTTSVPTALFTRGVRPGRGRGKVPVRHLRQGSPRTRCRASCRFCRAQGRRCGSHGRCRCGFRR